MNILTAACWECIFTEYADEPFADTKKTGVVTTVPKSEEKSSRAFWDASYETAKMIRILYINKPYLQDKDNFELRVKPAEAATHDSAPFGK